MVIFPLLINDITKANHARLSEGGPRGPYDWLRSSYVIRSVLGCRIRLQPRMLRSVQYPFSANP